MLGGQLGDDAPQVAVVHPVGRGPGEPGVVVNLDRDRFPEAPPVDIHALVVGDSEEPGARVCRLCVDVGVQGREERLLPRVSGVLGVGEGAADSPHVRAVGVDEGVERFHH